MRRALDGPGPRTAGRQTALLAGLGLGCCLVHGSHFTVVKLRLMLLLLAPVCGDLSAAGREGTPGTARRRPESMFEDSTHPGRSQFPGHCATPLNGVTGFRPSPDCHRHPRPLRLNMPATDYPLVLGNLLRTESQFKFLFWGERGERGNRVIPAWAGMGRFSWIPAFAGRLRASCPLAAYRASLPINDGGGRSDAGVGMTETAEGRKSGNEQPDPSFQPVRGRRAGMTTDISFCPCRHSGEGRNPVVYVIHSCLPSGRQE